MKLIRELWWEWCSRRGHGPTEAFIEDRPDVRICKRCRRLVR